MKGRPKPAPGDRFNRLTLVKLVGSAEYGRIGNRVLRHPTALWRCDCGAEKVIPVHRVVSGATKSCGCLLRAKGDAWRAARRVPTQEYMKDAYVIVDTGDRVANRLFYNDSPYRPWIVHSFTDELRFALLYDSRERAEADCDYFTRTKFEFDGNTPLEPGRLKVMKLALVPVEQGG